MTTVAVEGRSKREQNARKLLGSSAWNGEVCDWIRVDINATVLKLVEIFAEER